MPPMGAVDAGLRVRQCPEGSEAASDNESPARKGLLRGRRRRGFHPVSATHRLLLTLDGLHYFLEPSTHFVLLQTRPTQPKLARVSMNRAPCDFALRVVRQCRCEGACSQLPYSTTDNSTDPHSYRDCKRGQEWAELEADYPSNNITDAPSCVGCCLVHSCTSQPPSSVPSVSAPRAGLLVSSPHPIHSANSALLALDCLYDFLEPAASHSVLS